ncbi:MAG: DUF4105 domain-containing protein [Gemmatimonadota bacterium]
MLGAALGAQTPRADSRVTSQESRPSLAVYLITVGEGSAVWEKFGHNSLWFVDSVAGVDEAYNWGTFDFKSPGFAWRFVTGETRYWVERYPGQPLIDFFANFDRTVELQRLNLTEAQAHKALAFARINALEANKYYRYDYFRDNCSTRVRDVIDMATDGALKSATSTAMTPRSYRSESVRLVDDLGFAQYGLTAALGRPADAPISLWESAFVPMRLRDIVRDVRVTVNGQSQPLVTEERVVYTTKGHEERADVPAIWLIPLIIGLALAIDLVGLGILGERHRGVDTAFRVEAAVFSAITGLAGAAILFAWLFTRHDFWASNENLLLLNPLSLWLAPLAIQSMRHARWARPAAITAVLVTLCAAGALILKGIGGNQENVAVLALAVPAHFAVAFGLWRRAVNQ